MFHFNFNIILHSNFVLRTQRKAPWSAALIWNCCRKWRHLQAHPQTMGTESSHFMSCWPGVACAFIWTRIHAASYPSAAASSCRVMCQRLGGALDVLGSLGALLRPAEPPKWHNRGFSLFNLLQRFRGKEGHNPKGSVQSPPCLLRQRNISNIYIIGLLTLSPYKMRVFLICPKNQEYVSIPFYGIWQALMITE